MLQNFHRSYKACLACRKRKSRCELGNGWAPGEPCRRCARQMKECVFPAERVAAKNGTIPGVEPRRGIQTGSNTAAATAAANRIPETGNPSPQPAVGGNQQPASAASHDRIVSDSVMRTVISSGNDALEVLFDPIRQEQSLRYDSPWNAPESSNEDTSPSTAAAQNPGHSRRLRGARSTSSIHEVWNACRFVKQGWFTAEEAVFFVDMFFVHLQKLTPVLTDFYSNHENHFHLLSSEPLLCCTILAVSSGYHALPRPGGTLRGFFIHERLWSHVQHLILRVILGQEKANKGKTRTLGSVQALLLLTDWHPRSLAFPPQFDGWDSDLLVHWTEDRNDVPIDKPNEARKKWLEDVINPARRAGHMSWMLTSCAISLALELGVFDDYGATSGPPHEQGDVGPVPREHLQNVLYLYAEQVALQHGRQSVLPQGISHRILRNTGPVGWRDGLGWFMDAWISLTKLTRIMMETMYPSGSQASQLLQSGRYINLVEHFRPMLSSWQDTYLMGYVENGRGNFGSFLRIEYYSARLYCHSLCIQAVIERCGTQHGGTGAARFSTGTAYDASDYQFIEEVLNSSIQVLRIATELADHGVLRYVPAHITFRIIAASIFLLKGLGIGVGAAKLQASLDLLQRTILALRSSAVDEMHLGLRYAALLEMHLSRFQSSFVASTQPLGLEGLQLDSFSDEGERVVSGITQNFTVNPEDWFSLPFETTSATADMNEILGFSGFDDNDLDFIWNLNYYPEDVIS